MVDQKAEQMAAQRAAQTAESRACWTVVLMAWHLAQQKDARTVDSMADQWGCQKAD